MIRCAMAVLALSLIGSEARALDLSLDLSKVFDTTRERFVARIGGRPVPVTARLATEGLGYSVVQEIPDPRGRFRVHVTCRDGGFSRALCPTPAHAAICPTARIACR